MLANIITIDWGKCFICQNSRNGNVPSTDAVLAMLSTLLLNFSEVNALEFNLEKVYTNGSSLIENLEQNNAVYHIGRVIKSIISKNFSGQLPSLIKYRIKLIMMSKLHLVYQLNANQYHRNTMFQKKAYDVFVSKMMIALIFVQQERYMQYKAKLT